MKRIIICCDGTWNKPGNKDGNEQVETNIQKIYQSISLEDDQGIRQIKFYHSGVGTKPSLWDKFAGGITGEGIDKNIKDSYKFIIMTYDVGDELYFFGFSRGAYTVRSIVGLIRNCGILKKENIHLVDEAYSLYRDRNDYTHPDSDLMCFFRNNYSIEQKTFIKFLGVFDTVGALGIPAFKFSQLNDEKYKFHDVKLSSTVQNAFHALALHEKRFLFRPTLWKINKNSNGVANNQIIKQCWFNGVHCNVGGGYKQTGLSNISLNWMIDNVKNVGLKFDKRYLDLHTHMNILGKLRNSYTFRYWFTPYRKRKVNLSPQYNAEIHHSVTIRYKKKNLPLPIQN